MKKESKSNGYQDQISDLENTIREITQEYNLVLNNMGTGYALHEIITGADGTPIDFKIVEVNQAFADLIGDPRIKIIGKTASMLFPKLDNKLLKKLFVVEKSGVSDNFDLSTETFKKLVNITALSAGKGKFITLLHDKTDRRKAESEIKVQQSFFENLFNSSPDAIVVLDIEEHVLRVNKKFEELFGYTEAECIDKSIISLIVPVELKEEGKELSVAAMAGDFLKGETIRTSKDGKRIYVSIIGRHILLEDNTLGIFGIYRDISEKKQAEMALLESEKQFRNIVDNSLVGIYLVQKSILKYCNLKFAQIFGYDTPDEIENLNVLSIIAPESSDMVTEKMRRHEAGIDYIAHYEFQGLKKDGTKITIETLGGRIMHNNEVAIQGTLMDVTDRKQAERDLKEAKERAEESDRLKSVFLANMSHELRTPLNAVIGFSNLLGEAEDIDEYKDFAGKIYVSGIHLLNLIEDLFDISIIESGNVNLVKSLLNLKHLFMELHDQMDSERQIMKKANLSLMVSIPEDKPDFKMLTDPVRLKRIFTNLLKNAFKFTNEGFIEFGYVIMNNTIEFFVKDTGIGIDRSNKEIIFERFRQADDSQTRTYEGAGLGLFLTKKLVELLGGKIWLKSELNVGSTFYFSFPINSRQQSQLGETIYKKSDELDWRDKTILIAEDDDSNYLLLKSFLKKSQIKIVRAKTGKEAIDLALAYDNIDLILMDVKMPEVNGLDATKIIKEEKEYIPIIVQTAFAFESDIEKSLKAGCDDYISKPLNKRTLMEKIENQLFSVGELD